MPVGLPLCSLLRCLLVALLRGSPRSWWRRLTAPSRQGFRAGFGLARGGVLLLAVAVLVGLTPLRDEPWWAASLSAPVLSEALSVLKPVLPQKFGSLLPLSE